MSRLLVTNKSFELLEPYEGKLSRTVLRGESSRKGADLLDIDQYLNEAHSFGLQSVRAHFNVLAWSDDVQELRHIRNDVGSQLALMECRPRHNTVDAATLYWAGMPGNAGDFPAEESFYTFIEPAVCFFTEETNYKSSSSPFGIKLCDRVSGRPLHLDISDEPMKKGIITNRNKFVLGGSGSGKSFFMNHLVRQYWEQGTHVVLVDTGNSYQGLCELIRRKTKGEDGVYFTYTEEHPISFNPFYTDDYYFDVEKKDSIKTLLLTLWKTEDDKITKTESGELGSAVNAYIERIRADRNIVPCFDSFYEYLRDDYRRELEEREIRVSREDFNIDNMLITLRQYYKGGRYDFLLNSRANIDLLSKRFVVFEVDSIKENKELFPVVTIIIMEAFINKMRRLKGVRKQLIVEEAWKALSTANMAEYLRYMYKTVRKYYGEAIVVTQEVEDIISSPVVKEAIINNSDCKILLDQRKFMNRFNAIQSLLGLTDKEKAQILSINQSNDPSRKYKEVWIGLGGVQSAVYATEVSVPEYLAYTRKRRKWRCSGLPASWAVIWNWRSGSSPRANVKGRAGHVSQVYRIRPHGGAFGLRAVRGGGRVGKPLGFSPGSHLPQPGTPGRRFLRGGVLQGRDTLLPSREEVLGRYPLLRPLRVCRPGLRCGARGAPALRLRGLLPGVGMTAQVFTN